MSVRPPRAAWPSAGLWLVVVVVLLGVSGTLPSTLAGSGSTSPAPGIDPFGAHPGSLAAVPPSEKATDAVRTLPGYLPTGIAATRAPPDGERPAYSGGNATPVAENGMVVGTGSTGSEPKAAAYDWADQRMYVANFGSDNITILNGTEVNATVNLPFYSFPDGIAYDPGNGAIYAALYGSGEVAVIENETIIANITVGSAPVGVAYDSGNGWVYVANSGDHDLSVINGTSVLATVGVGIDPVGVAYDSASDLILVTNNQLGTLSFVSGTTVVHTSPTGLAPVGVAFDPSNGLIYVANSGNGTAAGTVGVYLGYRNISTLRVGSEPWGIGYDPMNGLVYVANSNSSTVSVLNTTHVQGKIGVGMTPYAVAYDGATGAMYVVDLGSDAVNLVSTSLWVGPPTASPPGDPAGSADIGENVTFNATLWGIGAGGNNVTVEVAPGPDLGCPSYVNLTLDNGSGAISASCRPSATGSYILTFLVTDQLGNSVWSTIDFLVYPPPTVAEPVVRFQGHAAAINSSDVGQRVVFYANLTGGTGMNRPFNWTGLSPANCSGLSSFEPICSFPSATSLIVHVAFNDTNGRRSLSPPLFFRVYALPLAALPTVSPSNVDVGQIVTFSEVPSGGPGTFQSFLWSGLPSSGGCVNVLTAHPRCTVTSAGINDISVVVTDTNGESSRSPTAAFSFDPLPLPSTPLASRPSADTGQVVSFSTSVSGGSGGFSYVWTGLPSFGCYGTTTATPSCVFGTPGTVAAGVTVTDSNGGVSLPSGAATVTVLPRPVVSTPTVTPSTVGSGNSVTITASVTGGSGGEQLTWVGLPGGCASGTASVTCRPTDVGSYSIELSVTDSNGATVNSSAATLTVTTTLPTLFGLSAAIFYGSILLIVIVVAVGLLVRRHRREAEREAAREAARQAELRAAVPGYRIDDPRLEHARGRAPPPP